MPHYRHLVMVPADMCASVAAARRDHLPFSLRAGRHGVTVNSGNAGRYDAGASWLLRGAARPRLAPAASTTTAFTC